MDALTIADTMGGTTPDAISYVVKKVIDRVKKPVEIHCHQDFGLGVANSIAALAAGASVAHTTITGLGERAGNVPMEDVVMSLLCLYGKDIGNQDRTFRRGVEVRSRAREGDHSAEPSHRRRQAVRGRIGHHRGGGSGSPARSIRSSTSRSPLSWSARSPSRSCSARTVGRRRLMSGARSWASPPRTTRRWRCSNR